MSFLAWVDFDQADRTRRIMDLFDNEDSRDELGFGSVRDALSDLMFPGTNTIQTSLRLCRLCPGSTAFLVRRPGQRQSGKTERVPCPEDTSTADAATAGAFKKSLPRLYFIATAN